LNGLKKVVIKRGDKKAVLKSFLDHGNALCQFPKVNDAQYLVKVYNKMLI